MLPLAYSWSIIQVQRCNRAPPAPDLRGFKRQTHWSQQTWSKPSVTLCIGASISPLIMDGWSPVETINIRAPWLQPMEWIDEAKNDGQRSPSSGLIMRDTSLVVPLYHISYTTNITTNTFLLPISH